MVTKGLQLHYVFYGIGLVFLFATLVYFSYEYVLDLSDTSKTAILGCLAVGFFFTGDLLGERDI
jgi:hypothetical protein